MATTLKRIKKLFKEILSYESTITALTRRTSRNLEYVPAISKDEEKVKLKNTTIETLLKHAQKVLS